MRLINKTNRKKRGAALVEYGLLIAGVALVSAAGISLFGKKTNQMIGVTASVLPGATTDDNGAIRSNGLIRTKNEGGTIQVDFDAVTGDENTMDGIYGDGAADLIDDGN